MTIKKIGLSLAAISFTAVAAIAGTGTVTVGSQTVSAEGLLDANVTDGLDLNATYTNALNAGVNQGTIVVQVPGVVFYDNNITNGTLYLSAGDSNGTISYVATSSAVVGANNDQINFDIKRQINTGDTLFLTRDDNATTFTGADVNATILKGTTTNRDISFKIVNANDTTIDSATGSSILKVQEEWSAKVKTSFNAQIDASQSFQHFTDGDNDLAQVSLTYSATDLGAYNPKFILYVDADNNISEFGQLKLLDSATETTPDANYDYNKTTTSTLGANTDLNATFTADGNATIRETTFKTSVVMLSKADSTKALKTLLPSTSMGSWTIYGYNAQIPSVTYATEATDGNSIDTKLIFTNKGTDSKVYMTINAADGTTCSYTDDVGIASGQTKTYVFSEVLSTCTNLPATGTYSVEVSIPTTPTKVYGFATYKNKTLKQFKDLPVYSNGTAAKQ